MIRIFFAALALLAPFCTHASSIGEIQRQHTNSTVVGSTSLRLAGQPAADKRIPVPDPAYEAPAGSSTGYGSTHFSYDADGNLIGEVVNPGTPDEQRITYTVDRFSNPPTVISEAVNGRITRTYLWVRGNELNSFVDHLPDGTSVTHYAHDDGYGSIRFLTDLDGNVTDTFRYDGFGNVTERTGTTDLRFLFRGEHLNPRTGWYHLRARWMDPKAGRFVSQDPFTGFNSDPQSLHKYTYAHNDPVNNSDPSGLFTLTEMGVATNIRSMLGNLQADVGFNLMDAAANPDSYDGSSIGLAVVGNMLPMGVKGLGNVFRNVKWAKNGRVGNGYLRVISGAKAHEIASAERIASAMGSRVLHRGGARGPDLIIDGDLWELKTLTTWGGKNTLDGVIDRALENWKAIGRSNNRIFIDGTAVGLTDEMFQAGLSSVRTTRLNAIGEIRYIRGDGTIAIWP